MNAPLANWNGTEMPLDEVRVPALDRSFLFGDGVYEVLRVARGRLVLSGAHFERLGYSLGQLGIKADAQEIRRRAEATLSSSGLSEALLYVQVSRGAAANRTHAFPVPPAVPNILIFIEPFDPRGLEETKGRGGRAVLFDDLRWKRCDIKSINLLGNVLAAQAAHEAGCEEAILVGEGGRLSEGAHSSVFGVAGGELLTAPLSSGVLPGITRRFITQLAEENEIPLTERSLTRASLDTIDELFLTGTTVDVMGIVSVDGRAIGEGTVGPVTRRFQEAYDTALSSDVPLELK